MSVNLNTIDLGNVHFVVARNDVEAVALALRKFASSEQVKTNLSHHTTKQRVYRCTRLTNGQILVGEC